jgi:hypothetical protein
LRLIPQACTGSAGGLLRLDFTKRLSVCALSCLFALGSLIHPLAASANDGGINRGGSPKLLAHHPSVRMENEVIHLDIYAKTMRVACDFTFVNHGNTCRVRMGFPDQGVGAFDPDEEGGDDVMETPPRTTFDSFESSVNGRPVATKLIRADKPGEYWHTKTVTFAAGQRVQIRDVYSCAISGYVASKGSYSNVGYIVHTGSSWHGTIGRTTIVVRFHQANRTGQLVAVPASRMAARDTAAIDWTQEPQTRIYYSGIGKPTVNGQTLTFMRTNWRPASNDDLMLYFRDWTM